MTPTFTIDAGVLRDFESALDRYMEHTKRALPYILNKKAMFIASFALNKTPEASKDAVLGDLYQRIELRRVMESSFVGVAAHHQYSGVFAPRIFGLINRARGKAGEKGLYGPAMLAAVQAMVKKRTRAVRSLKAGWIKPLRTMSRAIKEAPQTNPGRTPRISKKGYGKPADVSLDTVSILAYQLASKNSAGKFYIDRRVAKAAEDALRDETRNMEQFVEAELRKAAEKAGVL